MNNKIKAAMVVHGLFAATLGLASAAPALARVPAFAGGMAHVTTPDMLLGNGVIHVVDRVLPP
jgi:hypothetical protein